MTPSGSAATLNDADQDQDERDDDHEDFRSMRPEADCHENREDATGVADRVTSISVPGGAGLLKDHVSPQPDQCTCSMGGFVYDLVFSRHDIASMSMHAFDTSVRPKGLSLSCKTRKVHGLVLSYGN